ncbi:hypothetical protein NE237_005882 [Protea cynaroides]|uniref:Uncharacterized protein n=1 Tax=Protea cynaroides TaxID=273540 RepID=A0A9Q0KL76_9MAGN|nr:hypothetical protein NE237_005882 [Protea cynaroides]
MLSTGGSKTAGDAKVARSMVAADQGVDLVQSSITISSLVESGDSAEMALAFGDTIAAISSVATTIVDSSCMKHTIGWLDPMAAGNGADVVNTAPVLQEAGSQVATAKGLLGSSREGTTLAARAMDGNGWSSIKNGEVLLSGGSLITVGWVYDGSDRMKPTGWKHALSHVAEVGSHMRFCEEQKAFVTSFTHGVPSM